MAEAPAPRLLQQVRERLRVKHYAIRTEQAYVYWIKRYLDAVGRRNPRELGGPEVEHFLTQLATRDRVAASPAARTIDASVVS